jgi:hypothetical protein
MKTILLAGCSWGAGVWNKDSEIVHPGLAKYLQDIGYNVVNLSQPGRGPFAVVEPIDTFLKVNSNFLDIEHIFVIQSDVARDFDQFYRKHYKIRTMDSNTLEHNIKYTYYDFYSKLNYIGEQQQQKINLIGGLTDLVIEFAKSFPQLDFIIPSWIQLMHSEASPIYIHQVENIPEDHKDKKQMLPFIEDAINTGSLFSSSIRFPDNQHPDELGHKILFDHLKSLHLFDR